ncbi:MAG: efflux RND transporter periplasmic adaptor subunit [Sinobacteraceae bacterium]|nr:efflux RND transporter periplasmic adaptor subunit [Nevskiaceae bacterium]
MSDSPHVFPSRSSPRPPRGVARAGLLFVALAVALAGWGIAHRILAQAALRKEAAAARLTVAVTHASPPAQNEALILPGNVQAWYDAPIYARTSGYLKRWYVDIGTRVKAGQLLAEIDTPEVDQQLRQAQADLATAQANDRLAQITAERYRALLATDSVSKQDADNALGDAAAKKALVASAQANVARLRELERFKRIVAPFDGVVTARNVDIGDLIDAGSGNARELFHIADTRRLRVYVQVPQAQVPQLQPGMEAELHFTEYPGKTYPAKLVNMASAIDPAARTMLVELQTDNAHGELLPGAYAEVHFHLAPVAGSLRLASNTLLFRPAGMQVATVDHDDRVRLKTLTLGRDFGTTVEVLAGLSPEDRVIVNPPDAIADGERVTVVQTSAHPQPKT